MPKTRLKLFREEVDESHSPTSAVLRSIRLPSYIWDIGNNIDDILTGMGYSVSKEGHPNTDKRFVLRKTGPGSHQWGSRGLYVNYYISPRGVDLSLFSSERRKREALKIAKKLEDKVTEMQKDT